MHWLYSEKLCPFELRSDFEIYFLKFKERNSERKCSDFYRVDGKIFAKNNLYRDRTKPLFVRKLCTILHPRPDNAPRGRTLAVVHGEMVGAETSFALDADEQRAASARCHELPGKLAALEGQRERPFLQSVRNDQGTHSTQ